MSLFSWMFPGGKKPADSEPESSGLSRMEPTQPARRGMLEQHANNGQPANRKAERMARRELLYAIVRESMTRVGVLSASYKFKVLSLDRRGREFLVMVDLAHDCGVETGHLGEIEAMIAQWAKLRHEIRVSAVYWRMNEHVAVGAAKVHAGARISQPAPLLPHPAPLNSRPAPLREQAAPSQPAPLLVAPPAPLVSQPAPLHSQPGELVAHARPKEQRSIFEPIRADEVAAFKEALAAGVAKPAAAAASSVGVMPAKAREAKGKHHGPHNYTLLTGFEDTEIPDSETRGRLTGYEDTQLPDTSEEVLSGTQYGELR